MSAAPETKVEEKQPVESKPSVQKESQSEARANPFTRIVEQKQQQQQQQHTTPTLSSKVTIIASKIHKNDESDEEEFDEVNFV